MTEDPSRWKLSDRDNARIFERVIAPRVMAGVRRPEDPRVIFIGGQAGSGKTTAHRQALDRVGEAGAVIADFDSLLTDHPGYAELLVRDDQAASNLVGRDAYLWLHMVVELAERERLNLIREGAMAGNSPEREGRRFAAIGYSTEADVMAVPAAVSRLSVLSRYQSMRDNVGFGRIVTPEIHDSAFDGIPRTLESNDERMFISRIRLHRWGGGIIYDNRLDVDRAWQRPARARAELEAERHRELEPAEAAWFVRRFAELSRSLPPGLGAQLPEIAELARTVGVDLADGVVAADLSLSIATDRERITRFTQAVPPVASRPDSGSDGARPAGPTSLTRPVVERGRVN